MRTISSRQPLLGATVLAAFTVLTPASAQDTPLYHDPNAPMTKRADRTRFVLELSVESGVYDKWKLCA